MYVKTIDNFTDKMEAEEVDSILVESVEKEMNSRTKCGGGFLALVQLINMKR